MSWHGETILRLTAGEEAPAGMEILRLLGTFERLTGTGTNTELVYVVVVRSTKAAPVSAPPPPTREGTVQSDVA